ncbi:MAG: hypothetical protein IT376_16545 [Polyangiaceae bacterium]|nr:hypothetical protein [Polyangiaceae bacterium]
MDQVAVLLRDTRQAVTLADLRYEPFPDVTHAIPELAPPVVGVRPSGLPKRGLDLSPSGA